MIDPQVVVQSPKRLLVLFAVVVLGIYGIFASFSNMNNTQTQGHGDQNAFQEMFSPIHTPNELQQFLTPTSAPNDFQQFLMSQ